MGGDTFSNFAWSRSAVGLTYYVTRRIAGTLIVTMVLHAMWDFGVFIQDHSVDGLDDKPVAAGGFLLYVAVVLGIIALSRSSRRATCSSPVLTSSSSSPPLDRVER